MKNLFVEMNIILEQIWRESQQLGFTWLEDSLRSAVVNFVNLFMKPVNVKYA